MTFDFAYPQALDNEERGWGPGWKPGMPIGSRPASYPGKIVGLAIDGVSFTGGIRSELAELAELLLRESLKRGYIPNLMSPGCWGGAFRPTKRSDGTYTTTPSNHSWYTALDINAPRNVYGATTHEIGLEMAALWKRYGWRWLGPPIKDWMHFDFAGSPQDAAAMTTKARAALTEEESDVSAQEWIEGFEAFVSGEPEPAAGWKRRGWRQAKRFSARVITSPGDHTHEDLAPVDHEHAGKVTVR